MIVRSGEADPPKGTVLALEVGGQMAREFVNIPFGWTVGGYLRGGRVIKYRRCFDAVPVEIPSYASSEMTLALSVNRQTADGRPLTEQYWTQASALLRAATDFKGRSVTFESLKHALSSFDRQLDYNVFPREIWRWFPSVDAPVIAAHHVPRVFRELLSDGYAAAKAAAEARAAKIVFVDGVLHVPAPEPVLTNFHRGRLTVGSEDNISLGAHFRMDRIEAATEWMYADVGRTSKLSVDVFHDTGSHEWTFDEFGHSVRQLNSVLNGAWHSEKTRGIVPMLPADFFSAFCLLRDHGTNPIGPGEAAAAAATMLHCLEDPKFTLLRGEIGHAITLFRWRQDTIPDPRARDASADLDHFALP